MFVFFTGRYIPQLLILSQSEKDIYRITGSTIDTVRDPLCSDSEGLLLINVMRIAHTTFLYASRLNKVLPGTYSVFKKSY